MTLLWSRIHLVLATPLRAQKSFDEGTKVSSGLFSFGSERSSDDGAALASSTFPYTNFDTVDYQVQAQDWTLKRHGICNVNLHNCSISPARMQAEHDEAFVTKSNHRVCSIFV